MLHRFIIFFLLATGIASANAYGNGFFVKIAGTALFTESSRAPYDLEKEIFSKSINKPEFAIQTGMEYGIGYILSRDFAIDFKVQLDGKDYKLNTTFDHSQLAGTTALGALSLLSNENTSAQINSFNTVISLTYYF